MFDIKNMTDEELKSLTDHIAIELKDRKNKEKNIRKPLDKLPVLWYNIIVPREEQKER